mmetsp:Transcript_137590/g.343368  ORF Transcript_137590/g.343368 Transcript_137590/m.343368 type:complete len:202 (+) Transcript_137590:274-879(+)
MRTSHRLRHFFTCLLRFQTHPSKMLLSGYMYCNLFPPFSPVEESVPGTRRLSSGALARTALGSVTSSSQSSSEPLAPAVLEPLPGGCCGWGGRASAFPCASEGLGVQAVVAAVVSAGGSKPCKGGGGKPSCWIRPISGAGAAEVPASVVSSPSLEPCRCLNSRTICLRTIEASSLSSGGRHCLNVPNSFNTASTVAAMFCK